jgi:hypothetical protein
VTRKAIISGLVSGLLLSLGLLYPTFVFFVYRINPVWFDADIRPAAMAPGLMISGLMAFFALLAVGILPAIRAGATSWSEGARAGALSGLVAAVTVFGVLVAPTNAWLATIPTFNYPPAQNTLPPEDVLTVFQQNVLVHIYTRNLPIVALGGVLVGWLLGGITGLVRRDQRDEPVTLPDAIEMRRGRRRWFARNDDATRAAIIAGLICGGLITFTSLSDTTASTFIMNPDAARIGVAITEVPQVLPLPDPLTGLPDPVFRLLSRVANVLSPVAVIAFFVFGALAIIFIKDPPRWFISRWSAATFAGAVVGALLYLPVSRGFYVAIGLWPYQAQSSMPETVAANPMLVSPQAMVMAFYLAPLVAGLAILLTLMMVGAVQGVIYGLLLPSIFRRPIDRALSIRSRLRDNPNKFCRSSTRPTIATLMPSTSCRIWPSV